MKLCECGCSEAMDSTTRKGKLRRFIAGHYFRYFNRMNPSVGGDKSTNWKGGRRTTSHGYALVRRVGDYVYEHIDKAEKALGHSLPEGAEVHHVNRIKSDNSNTNLVICQDSAYHQLLHARQRAYDATGNASMMKCRLCKQWETPELLQRVSTRRHMAHHAKCNREDLSRRKPWLKKQTTDCQPISSLSI